MLKIHSKKLPYNLVLKFNNHMRSLSTLHMLDSIKLSEVEVIADHRSFCHFVRGSCFFKGEDPSLFAFKIMDLDFFDMDRESIKGFFTDAVINIAMYYNDRGLTC